MNRTLVGEKPGETQVRPLGVRAEVSLTADQLGRLAALEAFDLSPVWSRIVEDGRMPPQWATEAVFEFRRYLGLRVVAPEPISMLSWDVDDVWHTCLIFTRLYADLCDTAFGRFLHHDPQTDDTTDSGADWREFQQAYESFYGPLGGIWLLSGAGMPNRRSRNE